MTSNRQALTAIHAGQRVFYVNPLDSEMPVPESEWLDAGWYYDSLGESVGPFESESEAFDAYREDEGF